MSEQDELIAILSTSPLVRVMEHMLEGLGSAAETCSKVFHENAQQLYDTVKDLPVPGDWQEIKAAQPTVGFAWLVMVARDMRQHEAMIRKGMDQAVEGMKNVVEPGRLWGMRTDLWLLAVVTILEARLSQLGEALPESLGRECGDYARALSAEYQDGVSFERYYLHICPSTFIVRTHGRWVGWRAVIEHAIEHWRATCQAVGWDEWPGQIAAAVADWYDEYWGGGISHRMLRQLGDQLSVDWKLVGRAVVEKWIADGGMSAEQFFHLRRVLRACGDVEITPYGERESQALLTYVLADPGVQERVRRKAEWFQRLRLDQSRFSTKFLLQLP